MNDYSDITWEMKTAIDLHFVKDVPIDDISIRTEQRDMLSRIEYVLKAYHENPNIDVYQIFYDLGTMRYFKDGEVNRATCCHAARREEHLLRYIIDMFGLPQPPEHEVNPSKNQQPTPAINKKQTTTRREYLIRRWLLDTSNEPTEAFRKRWLANYNEMIRLGGKKMENYKVRAVAKYYGIII